MADTPTPKRGRGRPRKPRAPGDTHSHKKMVRLDEPIHEAFAELAAKNDRPLVWEIRRALLAHLKANGIHLSVED